MAVMTDHYERACDVYYSNELNRLFAHLAERIGCPETAGERLDPLQPEYIMVQTPGMERWLSLALAQRLGVCANVVFLNPNDVISRLVNGLYPEERPEASVFDSQYLNWAVYDQLCGPFLQEPAAKLLVDYIDGDDLRRLQLANEIADGFFQLMAYRPAWIQRWDQGLANVPDDPHEAWQMALWQQIAIRYTHGPIVHRVSQVAQLIDQLDHMPLSRIKQVLPRLWVFGISTLAPLHIRVLSALSRVLPVRLYTLTPTDSYWADLKTDRQRLRLRLSLNALPDTASDDVVTQLLHDDPSPPLISHCGKMGREFQALLLDLVPNLEEHSVCNVPREPVSMLDYVKSDLFTLTDRCEPGAVKPVIAPEDTSIRVISAHNAMREVEILYQHMLNWFDRDSTLRPDDVLVMTPDIETYLPMIQTVFSPIAGKPRLPFSVADRSVRNESRIADALLMLLGIFQSRLEVTALLALLEIPAIHTRFNLKPRDLDTVEHWIRETGIAWGKDTGEKTARGLAPVSDGTWRQGLDRLVLGYALPDQNYQLFQDQVPYTHVEADQTRILSNVLVFMEAIFSYGDYCRQPRTLSQWAGFLEQVLDRFFNPDPEAEREFNYLRQALDQLGQANQITRMTHRIALAEIRQWLNYFLSQNKFGFGFLSGNITFCSMIPMRSLPFKIIALLGMNDGLFPRQTRRSPFDLVLNHPALGDRKQEDSDRYLFFETILSAQEKLWISYVGKSSYDNTPRLPSIVVQELLESLSATMQLPGPVTESHFLHPWSPQYFLPAAVPQSGYFTYLTEHLAAAQSRLKPAAAASPQLRPGENLGPPGDYIITVEELIQFYVNPARWFLNRGLNARLVSPEEGVSDTECFALTHLDRYHLTDALLQAQALSENPGDGLAMVRHRAYFAKTAALPAGTLGGASFAEAVIKLDNLISEVPGFGIPDRKVPDVAVDVTEKWPGHRVRIMGSLTDCYEVYGLVRFRPGTLKFRDRMALWIQHVLYLMSKPADYGSRSRFVDGKSPMCLGALTAPETHLRLLASGFLTGQHQVFPFVLPVSWTFVVTLIKELGLKYPVSERELLDADPATQTECLAETLDTLGSDKSYDLRDVYIRWALSQMRLTDHHSDWFGDFAAWSIMLVLPILNAMKAADD